MSQRLLIIDDEVDMLRLFEKLISSRTKYELTTTNNSLEAPEILDQKQFDVIVTDLRMPGIDGMDILRFIRENDRFEQVIIITAFGTLESATEAMSLEVFDYITKPFKIENMLHTINRAMKFQQTKREMLYLSDIFEIPSFEEAKEAFIHEYIRRLAFKFDNDISKISRNSGIARDLIQKELDALYDGKDGFDIWQNKQNLKNLG